jgi:mRNA-degrading endonuclease RelE of RelBE toxin-antitoxin system
VEFRFTPEARAQLRAIDRATALDILEHLSKFASSRAGTIEPLHGTEWSGCFRLRVGDYRVIFRRGATGIDVLAVGHRSDVYR